MNPVGVVIVGCGAIGEIVATRVYPTLVDIARVVAVVDAVAERATSLARTLDAMAYPTLQAALADPAVEVVDIRLPHRMHAAAAMEAIRSGRDVLVEKPLATSLDDARTIVQAAAARPGLTLAVGENYAFLEPVLTARRLIDDGEVGEICAVRTSRVFELAGVWVRDGWRLDNRQDGGVVIDQATHQTSMIRKLAGEITHVHAFGRPVVAERSCDDAAVVNLRCANGIIAQQFYAWTSPFSGPGVEAEVTGTKGTVQVHVAYDEPGGGTLLIRPDLSGGRQWVLDSGDYYASLAPVVSDWLMARRDGRPPRMTGEEGLADLAAGLAIQESMASGKVVTL